MYCQNCGKEINKFDNFCRFCGHSLKIDENDSKNSEQNSSDEEFVYEGEELVLVDVKKHIMALFWTLFLTPLFIIYFWTIFLNTDGILSWIIVFGILALIIYPALCYKSESFVITTKSAHVKVGVIRPEEIEIPLEDFDKIDITQSSLGRIFDYGTITFCHNSERYDYPYVKSPEELLYIFKNPKEFIEQTLKEDVTV